MMLETQYRMHRDIAEYPSARFYEVTLLKWYDTPWCIIVHRFEYSIWCEIATYWIWHVVSHDDRRSSLNAEIFSQCVYGAVIVWFMLLHGREVDMLSWPSLLFIMHGCWNYHISYLVVTTDHIICPAPLHMIYYLSFLFFAWFLI